MRFFNLKRLLVILIIGPIFIINLLINRFFMLLDNVLFPKFKRQDISNAVLIVAAPRSGTTFLFHTLAEHNDFTTFKLWEMIFAPSICQKYLFRLFLKMDAKLGNCITRTIIKVEDRALFEFRKTHKIGLRLPEEDEVVMLWSLQSIYFTFFYPDTDIFDHLYHFIGLKNKKRQERIIKSYQRYIQRHNYFYNRNNDKRFLSKNPALMGRISAVHRILPAAQIININRCVSRTIPSTEALTKTLSSFGTSRNISITTSKKSKEVITSWYELAEKELKMFYPTQFLKVDFLKIIKLNETELNRISEFLNIPVSIFKNIEIKKGHRNQQKYTPLSTAELELIWGRLPFMKSYYTPNKKGSSMEP